MEEIDDGMTIEIEMNVQTRLHHCPLTADNLIVLYFVPSAFEPTLLSMYESQTYNVFLTK